MPDLFAQPAPTIDKPLVSLPIENHIHTLASFCQNPVGIRFNSQGANEQILLLLRAHFITNLPWIVLTLFFALIPPVLTLISPLISSNTPFSTLPPGYITILLSLYYLVVFAYAFVNFLTWFYNVFLVTNERVVDIDFSNIVYHQVAATKIDLVEDVHYDQIGFIPSLFDFGTIFLSTASNEDIFEAINVPHPAQGVQIIGNIIGENP